MTWIRTRAVPIFVFANAVVFIHLLDDAFLDGPRGISVWSSLATDAVPMAVALAALIAFPFLTPALQAWLAFLFSGRCLRSTAALPSRMRKSPRSQLISMRRPPILNTSRCSQTGSALSSPGS